VVVVDWVFGAGISVDEPHTKMLIAFDDVAIVVEFFFERIGCSKCANELSVVPCTVIC